MPRDKNARKKYYSKLVERDGECCRICKRRPPQVYLEVDHINGDVNNNDINNLQLLCETDNRRKNPRGKGKKKRRKVITTTGPVDVDKGGSAELRLSKRYQVDFRHWLYDQMQKRGTMTAKEVIFEGAEACNCSPFTIRTSYLPMVTSKAGMYQQYHDESAGCDKVVFRNAKDMGINLNNLDFVDEEPEARERE